jgi:hypothetical protein
VGYLKLHASTIRHSFFFQIKVLDEGLWLNSDRGKHTRLSFDECSGMRRARIDSLFLWLLEMQTHVTCIFTFPKDYVDARCVVSSVAFVILFLFGRGSLLLLLLLLYVKILSPL